MSALLTSYLGSVNRWECDENDHLNVRFYVAKAQQAIGLGLAELKIIPHAEASSALQEVRRLHIRYLSEARIAAPLKIEVGVTALDRRSAQVVAIMKHTYTDAVHAAFTADLVLATMPGITPDLVSQPDFAAPRGLSASELAEHRLTYKEALAKGFKPIGAGLVGLNECGSSGWMDPAHFMGRTSDGIPNLRFTGAKGSAPSEAAQQGGAVLEHRLDFHGRLRAGDGYQHLAGVLSLGEKTHRLAHLIFDAATERCVLSAEAVSITLNLKTRKSMAMDPESRRAMQSFLIKQ